MPNVITASQWKEATIAIAATKQSQELKDLTAKFDVLAQRETGASYEAVKVLLKKWKSAKADEVNKLGTNVADLEHTLKQISARIKSAPPPAMMDARGYEFGPEDLDYPEVPANERLPPFTRPEVARINEAVARAKQAVVLARDALIAIAKQDALVNPKAPEQLYIDYFGVYDKGRAKLVLKRFKLLCEAFNRPVVLDHRNRAGGKDVYAFCNRRDLDQWLNKQVRIRLGRVFFSGGQAAYPMGADPDRYRHCFAKTSDATLGTLVHEVCHGSWRAADAPRWEGGRWNPGPPLADGMSPNPNIQSSSRTRDRALASDHPDIALNNADNYGQFACEIAILNGK